METRLFILYFFVVRIQGAYEFPSKYKSGRILFQFVWEQWQDILFRLHFAQNEFQTNGMIGQAVSTIVLASRPPH